MTTPAIHRLAAFTTDPGGGNPAGVVVADGPLADDWMQATAAEVGYSETAFLWPGGPARWTVRYFSPMAEVPFCGHATIATGVLLAEQLGPGDHVLDTRAGEVALAVDVRDGLGRAALTSVAPRVDPVAPELLDAALDALGLDETDLDVSLAPVIAFAGARHLVLPVRRREVLAAMAYDFEALLAANQAHDLTTTALLWRERDDHWHARNPFPVGGVVEDPATGAAAAAIGGWLRSIGLVTPPADLVIEQGVDMGRPSRLEVHVPVAGGITVAGHAVRIDA